MAVALGQIDVEKDDARKGMTRAVGVFAITGEIIDGLLAIRDHAYRIIDSGALAGHFVKKDVVGIIFDQQYGFHQICKFVMKRGQERGPK